MHKYFQVSVTIWEIKMKQNATTFKTDLHTLFFSLTRNGVWIRICRTCQIYLYTFGEMCVCVFSNCQTRWR